MSESDSTFCEVPADELNDTLGLADYTLQKWVERGKIGDDHYTFERTPGRGRPRLIIDPRGLPKKYLERWVDHRIEEGDLPVPSEEEALGLEWQRAADWRKEEAEKRYQFYGAVPEELTTEAKRNAIAKYKEQTPESERPGGVSLTTWYRYRDAHEEAGLAGLMPDPRPSKGTKISETDYERFKTMYLTRDRRSARECWRRVFGAAKEEGRDVEDFPVPQTFVNAVKRKEGEDVITICREGKEAFYQKHSPHIKRDWSGIPAGDIWFSDHRLFDVFVLDTDSGEVGRPWFTPWMDARSTHFLSWDLYLEHPNSDRIHLTFKRAVEDYGVPKVAYIDNGKDYRALDFAGGRPSKEVAPDVDTKSKALLDVLGVDAKFARPYNSRAKTIERKFQFFIEKLEKFTRGYAGSDAERRPEITERRRKASTDHPGAADEMDFLCTLQEFRERVGQWVHRINRTPSNGRILDGQSPKEAFYAQRKEVRHIDKEQLGMLCLRSSSERQIRRCEFYDAELDITYTADWMHEPQISGTTAFARRDPQDPDMAWIFRANDGSLIGTAERKEKVHAMARELGDEEDEAELERQIRIQENYVQSLIDEKEEIEQKQPDESTLDAWGESYLDHIEEKRREEGDYELPEEPDHTTAEAQDRADDWKVQAEAQEQKGRDELPYDPEEAEAAAEDEDDESVAPEDLDVWGYK